MGQWWKGRYTLAEFHERLKVVPDCRTAVVQDAGHMLHHDQPQAVAALIEHFMGCALNPCAASASSYLFNSTTAFTPSESLPGSTPRRRCYSKGPSSTPSTAGSAESAGKRNSLQRWARNGRTRARTSLKLVIHDGSK